MPSVPVKSLHLMTSEEIDVYLKTVAEAIRDMVPPDCVYTVIIHNPTGRSLHAGTTGLAQSVASVLYGVDSLIVPR